ncbi:class I SAM-dependent methyltransferase [Novosphingobium tardum]|uniref:Class I SAM-dependent methyltransferase n=1 Tax=Novosphingobium tardum TaxID=1538021 RepID=A0ABV8RJR8_9SPHN
MPAAAPPDSLADKFARLIERTGPMSIAAFMAESNARYYSTRDPLGSAGDFVTAPEISQMFGELIGLWLADMWIRSGRREPVRYVELGPGRGTLARDALGAARRYGLVPQVHLVESSPTLRALQAELHPTALWHDTVATVPDDGPILLVANEFLDALPVRQLVRTHVGWRERLIGREDGAFIFVAGSQPMDAAVPAEFSGAPEGTIIETSPASSATVEEVADRLVAQGGAALFIDYGHAEPRFGSTLQAVRGHRKLDPFAAPGEADLSAHVDFAALAQVAQRRGARWLGTAEQGDWLRALGIETRAANLAAFAPQHAVAIAQALERLTGDRQMGRLFKVMGLGSPDAPAATGF